MVKIFVEGKEDKIFIDALIGFHFPDRKDNFEIISTGGWTKLLSSKGFHPRIKEFNKEGALEKVLVIFDADAAPEGGFSKRLESILKKKEDYSLEFEVFLFPDNQSDGDLELLLEQIVNDEHRDILKCFQSYEECLSSEPAKKYQLPIRKSKIYAYVDAFPKSQKEKEDFKKGDFLFYNESIWNLNSDRLKPLIEFIKNNHEN